MPDPSPAQLWGQHKPHPGMMLGCQTQPRLSHRPFGIPRPCNDNLPLQPHLFFSLGFPPGIYITLCRGGRDKKYPSGMCHLDGFRSLGKGLGPAAPAQGQGSTLSIMNCFISHPSRASNPQEAEARLEIQNSSAWLLPA